MLAATLDMTKTEAADVETFTEYRHGYPLWAGQAQSFAIRLVNSDPNPITVSLSAVGECHEWLSLSNRRNTDYAEHLTLTARAQGMSDTVWLRIEVPEDATTNEVSTTLLANETPLTLTYESFGTWDSKSDPYERYSGEQTQAFLDIFGETGQLVTILPYHPQVDKTTIDRESVSLAERNRAKIERWIDPLDPEFWQSPETDPYLSPIKRRILSDERNIEFPYPLAWPDEDSSYGDSFRVLLPPDLYLAREYCLWGQVSPGGPSLFSRSVYVLLMDGLKYSIERLTPRWTSGGEFAFWSAEARLIFAPSDNLTRGWLPWNALYEFERDEIRQYMATVPESARTWGLSYGGVS